MDPQTPYRQPLQSDPQPGSGSLPPLSPTGAPAAPQPVAPTSQYQASPYAQPSGQPGQSVQPLVDYGTQPTDQQREQFSIDYLNRIAPQEQKRINKFAVFGLIGAVIASLIFIVVLMSQSSGPNVNTVLPQLDARIQTLQTATAAQQTHLTENDISEANASLSSALGTMDTELQAIIKSRGLKKLSDKAAVTKEKAYLSEITKQLDDAYQKGTLDRTYTAQMTYELSLLRGQLTKLKKQSTNNAIQTFCDNGIKSIDITLKSYAAFDASKS